MLAEMGADGGTARYLAYRLYRICDRRNRPEEALGYNALVQSWPEIVRLVGETTRGQQGLMLEQASGVGDT